MQSIASIIIQLYIIKLLTKQQYYLFLVLAYQRRKNGRFKRTRLVLTASTAVISAKYCSNLSQVLE